MKIQAEHLVRCQFDRTKANPKEVFSYAQTLVELVRRTNQVLIEAVDLSEASTKTLLEFSGDHFLFRLVQKIYNNDQFSFDHKPPSAPQVISWLSVYHAALIDLLEIPKKDQAWWGSFLNKHIHDTPWRKKGGHFAPPDLSRVLVLPAKIQNALGTLKRPKKGEISITSSVYE